MKKTMRRKLVQRSIHIKGRRRTFVAHNMLLRGSPREMKKRALFAKFQHERGIERKPLLSLQNAVVVGIRRIPDKERERLPGGFLGPKYSLQDAYIVGMEIKE